MAYRHHGKMRRINAHRQHYNKYEGGLKNLEFIYKKLCTPDGGGKECAHPPIDGVQRPGHWRPLV